MEQIIRTRFPVLLAEVYQSAELATNNQVRANYWVDFFGETVRYLSLAGLSICRQRSISDDLVNQARNKLGRPSLGHWIKLLQALDQALTAHQFYDLTPPLNKKQSNNEISHCVNQLKDLLGNVPLNTVRLSHFLETVVEFRNKKIGHGSMTSRQAEEAVRVIKPAMFTWLEQIKLLHNYYLLYIHKVEWDDPHFLLKGTKNLGTSLYNANIAQTAKVTGQRIYLARDREEAPPELISLHPYLIFDDSEKLFYIYDELSANRHPLLRCVYKAGEYHKTIEIEEGPASILGDDTPQQPDEPDLPNEPKDEAQPVDLSTKETHMKPWYDLIRPHEDIRKGRLDEAVFHADLGDVASNIAPDDYNDAYLFFKKTYLTQGIENLLKDVNKTLIEGSGSSVVQIQTPFGGGKTHALVAIYHYLKHGESIKGLIPSEIPLMSAHVTAIAGNHWNPVEGMAKDGLTRRTFWGELAYQLGGPEGYEVFRENDETRIAPGKDKLRRFLLDYQPFVLLFDEVLEYINRALDRQIDVKAATGVSLGTQTFSFFQELTEAITTIPQGMMIVTLPSSYLEDFSDDTEESLARLSKIFGRVESITTPVHGEEVYEVIRRRLFEFDTMKWKEMREVVYRYFQAYKQNRDDLPPHVRDVDYRDKMEKAFPFHPGVIDLLYEKWSTFSTFQRTRGVLRMLANVIEDLYQREVSLDMILPGDTNLDRPEIRQEFLKHIGPEYEGVIGSDIAGHEAKSRNLDKANKQWNHLAERISTAIFYHSFSADDSEKGANLSYIKLATMRSDDIPAMTTEVLQRLSNILWYLNSRGDAYYFSDIPNLNRMILDKKELFNDSYEPELRKIIEGELTNEFRVYLWPESGDGIPDNRDLKLVILRPEDSGSQISTWLERKGETFREFKNTLFFALADTAAFASLKEDVKKLLALQEIKEEIRSGVSKLPEEKVSEVDRQLHAVKRDFSFNVRRMYHLVHLGDREVDLGNPTTGNESLSRWIWRELSSDHVGAVLTTLHYRFIVNKFFTGNGKIPSSAVLDQFYKDTKLPVPASPQIIARAIQLGIQDGALGLVEIINDEIQLDSLKYKNLVPLDGITFEAESLLLSKEESERLSALIEDESEDEPESEDEDEVDTPGGKPGAGGVTGPRDEKRYHRVRLVIADIPASKIADVNRGILMPFTRSTGDFQFTLEIDIADEEGISESILENQVKETIRQIGGRIVEEEIE